MTSLSDQQSSRGRNRLSFIAATRLHARRFHKSTIRSAVTLATADRLVTHPDGGVVALTRLGRTRLWTALAIGACLPALVAFVAALATQNPSLIVASAAVLIALMGLLVTRAERQIRGGRVHSTADRPWLLSDIATEPHRQVGDHLLVEVCNIADAARTRVVLSVGAGNAPAASLYERHRFEVTATRDDKVAMERRPA